MTRRPGSLVLFAAASLLFAAAPLGAQVLSADGAEHDDTAEQRLAGENLLALARVQARLDELDAAEKSFLDGIELITAADGGFAPSLIDAYRGLADVFARRGDFAEAVTVLEQAQQINRRNYGLFNLDQAELLDDMTGVFEQAGDTPQALAKQRELLDVAMRHYGTDDTELAPFYYRLADYYQLSRMRGLARDQFEKALELLRSDPESRPADTLKPLREIVRIDIQIGEQTQARRELVDALAASSDAASGERAESLAVLGDAELVDGSIEAARQYYANAFTALGDPATAETLIGQPQMLTFVPPPSPVDFGSRRNRPYGWGSITAEFTLSETGRAEQIRVTASNPAGLMDALYAQRLAEAVFRPRLVAGAPVATPRMRYSHEFRYFLPDDD
jgi:tetratricopeptide (TPR) repeat protein